MRFTTILLFTALLLFTFTEKAHAFKNNTDSTFNKNRLLMVAGIESSTAVFTLSLLNISWYSNYEKTNWHTFNDNAEWLQMDKAGHIASSYYLSHMSSQLFSWSGLSNTNSTLFGTASSLLFLSSVEMLDAYNTNWGFSWGDMAANCIGAGVFTTQNLIWKEQRFQLKYSFHKSEYAKIRPNTLGENIPEQLLKDYNGQSYWISANVYSFMPNLNYFPKWLNFAFGYGANGLLGGFSNPVEINGLPAPVFKRYRQYYLSLDIDLTKIPCKSKFVKSVLTFFSCIKIPSPSIELSQNKLIFHPIMF